MKTLKIASLFLFVFLTNATSCEDDDIIVCLQSDWIATYMGSIDCGGTIEEVTVTITADGADNLVISYETPTISVDFDPLPFNNCSLEATATQDSLGVSINAFLPFDDAIEISQTTTVGPNTTVCTITATKN